jgi:AcrR family transcriptional regulator
LHSGGNRGYGLASKNSFAQFALKEFHIMSRRIEILRRATEVFERRGVNRTSMEDIANAVGIKREAIYYYFDGRGEILVNIILPQSRSLCLALETILNSNMSGAEKLRAAIRNHLDKFNPNYLEMTVALREDHFAAADDKMVELRKVWRDYGALWTQLIAEGQRSSEFRGGIDPKLVSFGVLGMCNWMSRWYDPSKSITIEQIIDTFYAMVSNGIVAAPPASS